MPKEIIQGREIRSKLGSEMNDFASEAQLYSNFPWVPPSPPPAPRPLPGKSIIQATCASNTRICER